MLACNLDRGATPHIEGSLHVVRHGNGGGSTADRGDDPRVQMGDGARGNLIGLVNMAPGAGKASSAGGRL